MEETNLTSKQATKETKKAKPGAHHLAKPNSVTNQPESVAYPTNQPSAKEPTKELIH